MRECNQFLSGEALICNEIISCGTTICLHVISLNKDMAVLLKLWLYCMDSLVCCTPYRLYMPLCWLCPILAHSIIQCLTLFFSFFFFCCGWVLYMYLHFSILEHIVTKYMYWELRERLDTPTFFKGRQVLGWWNCILGFITDSVY